MRAPAILAETFGKPDDLIANIPQRQSVDSLKPLLTYYDSVAILKEKFPPVDFRIGEDSRRLTFVDPNEDHQFLIEKERVFGHFVTGEMTLAQACEKVRRDWASSNHPIAPKSLLLPHRIVDGLAGQEHCLVCDFVGSLPIPGENVSLDDVFSFRERRADELSQFWHYLYDVANSASTLTRPFAEAEVQRILGKSLEDCQKVASETWGSRVARSMSLRFQLNTETAMSIGAAILSSSLNAPPVATVLLGALGAVRFSIDLLPKAERLSESARALSYAIQVDKQLS